MKRESNNKNYFLVKHYNNKAKNVFSEKKKHNLNNITEKLVYLVYSYSIL